MLMVFESQLMITEICNYPKISEVYGVINGWVYVHTNFYNFFFSVHLSSAIWAAGPQHKSANV